MAGVGTSSDKNWFAAVLISLKQLSELWGVIFLIPSFSDKHKNQGDSQMLFSTNS